MTQFMDLDRTKWDERDVWRGNEQSGAFLTWLKDENLETFSAPEQGILPHGVNNVDCVVNANVLFAPALNDARRWAGFEDAKHLLIKTVNSRAWTGKCGHYYPQLMMLPYILARAYREGRMFDDSVMQKAMRVLLRDLLAMEQEDGSFPGGGDEASHLSTALATNALINIGFEIAQKNNLSQHYQVAIAKAIQFLVTERRRHRLLFSDVCDTPGESQPVHYAFTWDSGLFFSGTFWDLVQWRSEAYTTAIVLEALVKFVFALDLDDSTLLKGRRLRIKCYDAFCGEQAETARLRSRAGQLNHMARGQRSR